MPAGIAEYLDTVTIADGAWATQLDELGCARGQCREAWNTSRPEVVRGLARAYVEAGAQIVLTNTFAANRYSLARHGHADQVRELNQLGARLSRQAAEGKAKVFGSMGPSGKILMMGEVHQGELYEAFREQAEALAEGGADGLVIETMSELVEAVAAVKAAKTTGLPVAGCMTFDSGKDQIRTMMGVTPQQAALTLLDAGADLVGCNCGLGIDNHIRVVAQLRAVTDKPIWVKSNAGVPIVQNGERVYRMTPEEFAAKARLMVAAGANVVGGCCGTNPNFTRALVAALKQP